MRSLPTTALALVLLLAGGCLATPEDLPLEDIAAASSSLTSTQRRARAGQIRDAAAANGMTQGYLLAGIADAETGMSHCWSELTWACQGPASPDCGGGPVVAGAGDGPCSLRQGGLGMFQFDAGTFDQTLAREGDRILRIDGNVAAAVDFVVAMVIRSAYIPGVDTREQAIEWMNGVRIGNARFDPWIKTVTHYYNGCRPEYSCWAGRYAHYRDNTVGVHDEMGSDFWDTTVDLAAAYVSQTFPLARDPFELAPGEEFTGTIELRNTGAATWTPGTTNLGTTNPRDGASALAGPDWLSPGRPATVDRVVPPGEVGRFTFTVRAPLVPGDYPQYFTLVQEGVAWFSDQGGPPDDQLQVRVTVLDLPPAEPTEPPADPVDPPAEPTEPPASPADPGTPPADGVDLDGDGWGADTDCDDGDPEVHPDAADWCGDGVDQDCDGLDQDCDGPAAASGTSASLSGGCAVAPPGGRAAGAPWALLPALAWLVATRRRRR